MENPTSQHYEFCNTWHVIGDYKMLVKFNFEYTYTDSFQASLICVGRKPYDCGFHSTKFFRFYKFFSHPKTQFENKIAIFNGKNRGKSAKFFIITEK